MVEGVKILNLFKSATKLKSKAAEASTSNPIVLKLGQIAEDCFESKVFKFSSPKIKYPENFNFLDVIKSGFKSKTKLALNYNQSEPVVAETSKAIKDVEKYILDNKSNIVAKKLDTGNAAITFADGTVIKLKEPHNMQCDKMTPQKMINITDINKKNIYIPAYANKNNSEVYSLFGLVEKLNK